MIGDGFLVADPDFFEAPERMADADDLFAVSRRAVPMGWGRATRGLWIGFQPETTTLPAQGWKVHLSVSPEHAGQALEVLFDHCVEHGYAFKFLRSSRAHELTNLKYATRGASGKLAAVYPEDENRLERLLEELGPKLTGLTGPYVLGDLRWGDGPLYLRYGAFLDRWAAGEDDGEPTLVIERPDASLEPDRRDPVFRVPEWTSTPRVVAEALTAAGAAEADFPVQITEALHHSNAGGVYLGADAEGRTVVVKEARPWAGLDPTGRDAVHRLGHEADVLRRLDGTGVLPRCLGEFTAWEHHFLVEELVDGDSLHTYLTDHYPYLHPDPDDSELAAYTAWALGVGDEVAAALAAVHARGLVFADLHANNVMVRSDGSISLIDGELAVELDGDAPVLLGDPAFRHPDVRSGRALDDYALACLRLSVLVPLTGLLVWDPELAPGGVAERLVAAAHELFPLPDGWGAGLLAELRRIAGRHHRAGRGGSLPRRAVAASGPSAEPPSEIAEISLERRLISSLLATATPERSDRLFPADPGVFSYGGHGLAHGAAGVLHAVQVVAPDRLDPRHLDWLTETALRSDSPWAGLYAGTAGAAVLLARVGRADAAGEVLAGARRHRHLDTTVGVFNGAAGHGLAALALGDPRLIDTAATEAAWLRALLHDQSSPLTEPLEGGLLRGWSGVALFLVRLFERTGDPRLLDDAAIALRRDLDGCVIDDAGALHVRDGARILLYLGDGAIGVGLALRAYLAHRDDADLRAAYRAAQRTCRIGVVLFGGLFNGRSGLLLGSSLLLDGAERDAVTALHRRRLGWHLIDHRHGLSLPGDGLVRLSTDFATGSAGAALALHAARQPSISPTGHAGTGDLLPALGFGPADDRGEEVNQS
ncbi:MAG TPA: class III lanthionine synthetase LanKC [Microlunatus sp.]|nr:class III lanthionine synthetase LanKC [Microlunatus sp.]